MRFFTALSALLVTLGLSACGGSRGGQPSWRSPGRASAEAPRPQSFEFRPRAPAVSFYNDPPISPAPSFPLGDAITDSVFTTADMLELTAPQPDGRLFAAAKELASVAPENGPLSYPLVEFTLQRHGIIEPSPNLIVIWAPPDEGSTVVDRVRERLAGILQSAHFARFGVGRASRGDAGEVTVLAFQPSFISTTAIPRSLPSGGTIRIEGRVHEPFVDPHVFVTRDNGKVEQTALKHLGSGGFRADIDCGDREGRQQIEITAADQTGSTVMANFPVWCRAEAPTSITISITEDDLTPVTDAATAEKRMVELVNADRVKHGLEPLEFDPRLATISRAHSDEMFRTGQVSHLSPTTGSAADRARAKGVRSALVLENVAQAYGLAEAEAALMNSPGHRANLLSEQATHIGIGIVLGGKVAGRHELFITQMFTRVPAVIDVAEVRKKVRNRILRAKDTLQEIDSLSMVAQAFADDMANGIAVDVAGKRSSKRLRTLQTGLRRVVTIATTVADVSSFDPEGSLSQGKRFGLGVSQGDHDVMGEQAIHIVVLLGQ